MTTAPVELAYLGKVLLAVWVLGVVLAFAFSYVLEREAPPLVVRECVSVVGWLPVLVLRIFGWEIPLWYGLLSAVTTVLIYVTGLRSLADVLIWWRTRKRLSGRGGP